MARSRLDITVGSLTGNAAGASGQTNSDLVSASEGTLVTDAATLTTHTATLTTDAGLLGTAVATAVALGASPTQASVTAISNAYNTMNAALTTVNANLVTVNADIVKLTASLTARPDVSIDYDSTVASLNALKAAFASALRLAASAGIS